jgi:hypothetical protein
MSWYFKPVLPRLYVPFFDCTPDSRRGLVENTAQYTKIDSAVFLYLLSLACLFSTLFFVVMDGGWRSVSSLLRSSNRTNGVSYSSNSPISPWALFRGPRVALCIPFGFISASIFPFAPFDYYVINGHVHRPFCPEGG